MNKNMGLQKCKIQDGIKRTDLRMKSFDGKDIQLYIYEKDDDDMDKKPCLVYYHGGAYYLDIQAVMNDVACKYVLGSGCKVVLVRYRTLEKVTYRTQLRDCYEALLWVNENAEKFGFDKDKIIVGGDSSGGTMAAAMTRLSRDLKGPKICYQMLIYPCVSKSMDTESMKKYVDTPMWNSVLHRIILGKILPAIDDELLPYFDILAQNDLEGLCNAYIEVEEFDCLHDQGLEYANKLMEHGYKVDFNDVVGTFHGFDTDLNISIVKDVIKLRCEMLRKAVLDNEEEGNE